MCILWIGRNDAARKRRRAAHLGDGPCADAQAVVADAATALQGHCLLMWAHRLGALDDSLKVGVRQGRQGPLHHCRSQNWAITTCSHVLGIGSSQSGGHLTIKVVEVGIDADWVEHPLHPTTCS